MWFTVCIFQVIDVINEEEKQFLKTLSRGKRVFERTVERMDPSISVIPGVYIVTKPCCWVKVVTSTCCITLKMELYKKLKLIIFLCVCVISRMIKSACNFTIFGSEVMSSSHMSPPALSGLG